MKKSLTAIIGLAAIAIPAAAFAAGITLTNGGLGQVASNPSQFGIAVCNGGKATVKQSAPVSISANGRTATASSASSIAAGACEYSYVSYNQLGMQAGQTYTIAVTIDPQKTLIVNNNNQATYSVTVPSAQSAQSLTAGANTADVNAQSGNIFTAFWNWFKSLF